MKYVFLYVAIIIAVNYGFSVVPMVATPWGDIFPPMTFAVGFVFIVRDYAQRAVGHWVLMSMLFSGVISWFMANPFIAVASVTAFAISEIVDWIFYSFTKKSFKTRILISSVASTPIDSVVFLMMIGAFSWSGFVAMFFAKMAGVIVVYNLSNGESK